MGIIKFISFTVTLLSLWSLFVHTVQTSQCELVRIPMCSSMQWNLTSMPNLMDQSSQQNARLKIEEYQPLVRDQCSEYLLFFLCAIFSPICTTNYQHNPIPPCREVCERVKTGCEPVIQTKYNKTWPANINCNNFPQYDYGVCISPQAIKLEELNSHQTGTTAVTPGTTVATSRSRSRSPCNCRKKTRLHIRRYVQANFDYVIRAAVEGTRRMGRDLVMSLNIKNILKNKSDLRLRNNSSLILWAEGRGCQPVCPSVRKRKEYIIACNNNASTGRLIFDTNTCMISRWRNKWARAIVEWERIVRLPQMLRNGELRRLRHVKRNRGRASPTQSSGNTGART